MLISILIPTLNEEQGIKKTIDQIPRNKLSELGYDVEVLIVDGDSTDNTRRIATESGARVILEKRKGYGRAYKTGLREAKGDIIVTLDADGTYPAELIPDYLTKFLEHKVDFMTINRFSSMEPGAMSLSHRLGNAILSFTMRKLYSINVDDSQSGMWVMRNTFIKAIILRSDDMSMSEEIKIIAFRYFRAIEVMGKYYQRAGTAKLDTFRHGWHNLQYLFSFKKYLHKSLTSSQRWA